jgi:hypothetical protein
VQKGLFRASIVEEGTLPGDRKIETAHLYLHVSQFQPIHVTTTTGLRVMFACTVRLGVIYLDTSLSLSRSDESRRS